VQNQHLELPAALLASSARAKTATHRFAPGPAMAGHAAGHRHRRATGQWSPEEIYLSLPRPAATPG
jgi:hypothetical protein